MKWKNRPTTTNTSTSTFMAPEFFFWSVPKSSAPPELQDKCQPVLPTLQPPAWRYAALFIMELCCTIHYIPSSIEVTAGATGFWWLDVVKFRIMAINIIIVSASLLKRSLHFHCRMNTICACSSFKLGSVEGVCSLLSKYLFCIKFKCPCRIYHDLFPVYSVPLVLDYQKLRSVVRNSLN